MTISTEGIAIKPRRDMAQYLNERIDSTAMLDFDDGCNLWIEQI